MTLFRRFLLVTPLFALVTSFSGAHPAAAADVSLTHSTAQTITDMNSTSCATGGSHLDNSYYRVFPLDTFPVISGAFKVTSVDIGIEAANDGGGVGQPLSVILRTSSSNSPTLATLSAPLATANVTVSDQALTLLNVPVSAVLLSTATLVVEVFTPDGTGGAHSLLIGSNALGQSAPSYFLAPGCGINEITNLTTLGQPNMHIVMNVNGTATDRVAPTNCVSSTSVFSNTTPVAVPTGPAVVASTIEVSGADPYLYDVDLMTNLQHTFAADLDITITSPAGTVVTLTTDNGAGNDNVFAGTVWDDSANRSGQVPYVTNAGQVTDHSYTNLTLASPLAPEEHLAAFIGENPNGTWTITISDDLAGDGGTLQGWDLELTALPSAPMTSSAATFTTAVPVAIPTGPAVVTSTVEVGGLGPSLLDLNLLSNLTHTFAADLDMTLMSPAGTIVTLSTDNGAGNDNVFNGTLWDDDANPAGALPYVTNNGVATDNAYVNLTTATPLSPEEAFGAFIGEDPNGTWTITISDDLAGDGGSIAGWSIDVVTAFCTTTSTTSSTTTSTTNAGATTTTSSPTSSSTSTTLPSPASPRRPIPRSSADWTTSSRGSRGPASRSGLENGS